MARPVGRASALGLRRFRDPNPISGPHGTARRADIDICLFWAGTGTLLLGWDTGDLPSQGKKLRASNPTRPLCSPRRDACGASPVPPHPLGVARSQSRGLTSSSSCRRRRRVVSSCRRVVAPVAPVPNCPSQGSTCASQQCSCKSQSLERLRVSDAGGSMKGLRTLEHNILTFTYNLRHIMHITRL
jgi:hypothetical protein